MELLLQKASVLRHMLQVILNMVAQVQTGIGRKRYAADPCGANSLNAGWKLPVFYLHKQQGYCHRKSTKNLRRAVSAS